MLRSPALVLWGCAALALAAWRVPFDDEWFSIELAFDALPAQLWAALEADVHPPWLALMDRGLAHVGHHAWLLQMVRVLFSATALALVSRSLAQPLGVPRSLFLWAAAHPLVLFYAGAARWYPLLWLAHALRLAALWHPRPSSRASAGLFLGGSVLGSMASYLDPLFVLHDLAWLAARSERSMRVRVGAIALAAVGGMVALRWLSPLRAPFHLALHVWRPQWHLRDVVAWGALGLSGETAFSGVWVGLGLSCVCAAAWGLGRALRDASARPVAGWLITYGLCWLLACGFGVDHARYSLLLWSLVPVLWLRGALLTAARADRILAAAALVHLALGLGLVVAGRGFFKADLNELERDECAQLMAAGAASDVRAVLVTYARAEELTRRRCDSHLPFRRVPSIRIVPDAEEQLSQLQPLTQTFGSVWLLAVQSQVSYARTTQRVHDWLNARCSLRDRQSFGRIPHPRLSVHDPGYRRFVLEKFDCSKR